MVTNKLITRDEYGNPKICYESQRNIMTMEEIFEYIDAEEDINQPFYLNGSYITILEFLLSGTTIEEEIIQKILSVSNIDVDKYDKIPPIAAAMKCRFSFETIETMIKLSKNLDREFISYSAIDDGQNVRTNLLGFALKLNFYNNCRTYVCVDDYNYRLAMAKLLIENKIDVNGIRTILSESEYADGVQGKVETNLETAIQMDINTPIWNGKDEDLFDYTKLLLENGADITKKVDAFQLRVEAALTRYKNKVIKDERLIEFFELLKLHREKDLDLNTKSTLNATPLLNAAQHGRYKLVKWLIENGADINAIGGFDNGNAMSKAISNWPEIDVINRKETVRTLIDLGLSKELRDIDGETPLMTACNFGATETARYLLSIGADPNATNDGKDPLFYSVVGFNDYQFYKEGDRMNESNKIQIMEELIRCGADPHTTYFAEGLTLLDIAERMEVYQIANYLKNLGVERTYYVEDKISEVDTDEASDYLKN